MAKIEIGGEMTDVAPYGAPLDPLAGDRETFAELEQAGFTGPAYDQFVEMLWNQSFPVVLSWLRAGKFQSLCKEHGISVAISPSDRTALHTDKDERIDLALDIIAKALKSFRRNALQKKRWQADFGASLTTYFNTACIFAFKPAYEKWSEERTDRLVEVGRTWTVRDIARLASTTVDADHTAAARDALTHIIGLADTETRAVLARLAEGRSHVEIGAELGLSARAVEGKLYRLRLKAAKAARHGRIEIPRQYSLARRQAATQ